MRLKYPVGPIQNIDEVFNDPQVLARNMIVELEHPEMGAVSTAANPIKFSATPVEYQKAPPRLGEDTESVLSEMLGYSEDAIRELKGRGVI